MLVGVPRELSFLPADVHDLLKRGNGVINVATAMGVGITADRLQRLARRGLLVRLGRGSYASSEEFESASDWRQYELRSRAFVLSCRAFHFMAEWSAVVLWGLPTVGEPPDLPVVITPPKASRGGGDTTNMARIRSANLPREHMRTFGHPDGPEYPAMSAAWTVADLARTAPVHHALVVADAALRAGEPLADVVPLFRGWAGGDRMRFVIAHADARSESPIESLGRFVCLRFKLPMPVANAWVGRRGPERRLDGLWPWHHAGWEADGAVKYDNRPDASKIVADQVAREWRIRKLGIDLARFGFREAYYEQRDLAARLRELLADNPPRENPVRWWKHDPELGPVKPSPEDLPSPHPTSIILPVGWSRARRP